MIWDTYLDQLDDADELKEMGRMDDADDARTNARTRYKAALDVRSKEKLEASKADTASHHELDSESDVPQHNGDARERLRMGSDQFLSLIQRAERISIARSASLSM